MEYGSSSDKNGEGGDTMVWESWEYNVSYAKVVDVNNTIEMSVYQGGGSMALKFALVVFYTLVVVGVL